jgi:glycosyltransferase involved in cell wall biosynthesis
VINKIATLDSLPPPPKGKIGFPWTETGTPQYRTENLPKITIITPSFNQGQFIEQTIRSVLLQNYPNLEYIIIDGGSTDNTVEIIKKYSDFITYWVSEKDNGQSDAINKGLKQATGDVFNWLNSDDFYLPNALLKVGQLFRKSPEINVLCGYEIVLLPDGSLTSTTNPPTTIKETLEETMAIANICQPPTFFKLSVVKQLGELSNDLYFCMDAEFWLRYLTEFGLENVGKTSEILNVFRVHPEAKSSSKKRIYYADRFNLLMNLVNNSRYLTQFPKRFLKENPIFTIYFSKIGPLSITDEKRLLALISQQLLELYSQFMSWQSFFELYFYSTKLLPNDRNRRFYLLPFIKLKRLFKPLTF